MLARDRVQGGIRPDTMRGPHDLAPPSDSARWLHRAQKKLVAQGGGTSTSVTGDPRAECQATTPATATSTVSAGESAASNFVRGAMMAWQRDLKKVESTRP